MPDPVKPRLLSLYDAGTALSIGMTSLRKLIKDGEIETVKIGVRRLVPMDEIDRYIEEKRAK